MRNFNAKHWVATGLFGLHALVFADPAIIFDMGGKFDRGFNESAYRGMEKWSKETGKKYLEFEVGSESQREQSFRRMAEKGASPIVAVGSSQAAALEKVAKEFPNVQFALIDKVLPPQPNIESVGFKEQEGSYLVGALAAMASKTGKLGFVGGMDIPIIRRFQCGYEQGVKAVNPQAVVLANMTGTTGAAWRDPARGGELAKMQFSQGADVVFAAAGPTSVGVYQAAKDAGKLAVGANVNENGLHPGNMLTSMLKSVEVAVYQTVMNFKPGSTILGLKEGGVDLAMDGNNASLVTPAMKDKLAQMKKDIISGKIKIVDYMEKGDCKF